MESHFDLVDPTGVRLHCAAMGDPQKPLMICLHGFPEYWAAWRQAMPHLASDYYVVAPDQRGYNLSSKPSGVEAYRTRLLAEDIARLAERLSPERSFVLAGHDWGASVAYAAAFAIPERISHLIIVNGVHPICFQRAILNDAEQRNASQYIHRLRAPEAETRLSENGFARMFNMLAGFSRTDWMTPDIKRSYLEAWSRPDALTGMLNWYRASPLLVPQAGETPPETPLLTIPREAVTLRMPHLVIWGEDDEALRPACLEELGEFAADLRIRRIAGAGHWILHEKPAEVARAIKDFLVAV